ncbi:MAG: glucose 1-dehydrogenase [Gammaproteobacteria bacterium]|jgi:3-oxoacyl-[acyl-carrier protein] reductase|nr:glucose 1-dehydrogenase [Gammaproteobacteria bacterium]MBT5603105.1 glucose 1-dehydrogenase [Gammaproteobacteria bacterium]MBT6244667.1 glucose 1-dehydrogenase [Gammaproteobacteria bacterium]
MGRFAGKSVIVTGAASGFGTAIARKFSQEGAWLVLADLNIEGAEVLAQELTNAIAVQTDVALEADNQLMVDTAVKAYGKIDVVCCNAGVPHKGSYMTRMSTEDFDSMWGVNVRSIFLATKMSVPHMPEGGSIISTASVGGKRPRPGLAAYNASKAAVINLTQTMAIELAPKIRANCVCPVSSATNFDFQVSGRKDLDTELEAKVVAGIPMGRRALPEDVADAFVYLASDEASFVTGIALDVDGGRLLS